MGQTYLLIGFTLVLFLVVYVSNANAIQDVNFTIDSSTMDLCLTSDDLNTQICDTNHTLTLDGTQDHFLYFTPKRLLGTNQSENSWNMVYTPIVTIFSGNILYLIFFMLIIVYLFVRLMIR